MRSVLLGTTILSMGFGAASAQAGGHSSLKEEIELLKKRLAQLENQLEKNASVGSDGATFTMKDTTPAFASADGSNTVQINGRAQVDAGWFNDDQTDFGDGTNFRRVWLGAKGKVRNDWGYSIFVDFAGGNATAQDVFLSYNGFKNTTLKVGKHKEPSNLENLTSYLNTVFMERSEGITPFRALRKTGLSYTTYGDQWGVSAGIFGADIGDTSSDDEGHSFTGRAHVAPLNADGNLAHIGASLRYHMPDAEDDSVRYRARPESKINDTRIVDTGTISGVKDTMSYGGEALFAHGPFTLQGEYNLTNVSREGNTDLDFRGGYLLASYVLTGESRGYNVAKGVPGRLKPKNDFSLKDGTFGALELAARYTTLDLTDEDILGGELRSTTFGINWYPTSRTKFSANYVLANADENAATAPDDDPSVFLLRAQVDF